MTTTQHPIRRLTSPDAAQLRGLADLLIDCVEGGASVSFMSPLSVDRAEAFWRKVADGAVRGERILLVAEDAGGAIVGTVQLVLAEAENQPHRADVAKMLVHRRARAQGLGAALMQAIEREAVTAGRTMLVLDTVTGDRGERLYTRCGWQRSGEIPDYALWPTGGLCGTTIFFKSIGSVPA